MHGDDYVGLCSRSDLEWYGKELRKRFIVKNRGVLGPGQNEVREMRILNRVLVYHRAEPGAPERITYEADQRYAELLCNSYGLRGNPRKKPSIWDKASYVNRHPLTGKSLERERVAQFKSSTMRLLYLTLDRPELQFASKELSRTLAEPTEHGEEVLKSAARFLHAYPRVVWEFVRQAMPKMLDVFTDSNWAGCPITRKSTSCTHVKLGSHPIFAGSSTQTIISLSSGESEFYGAVRAACRLLGMQSLLRDLGFELKANLYTDSTAAKGLASRRGAGRVRHIHCPALWLQQAIANRALTIHKKPGKELSPDIGTKAGIPTQHVLQLLASFGCKPIEGTAAV